LRGAIAPAPSEAPDLKKTLSPRAGILLAAVIVINTACPSSTSTAPRTTGSLQITVTGLPAGVSASVTVTGPAAFNESVTATQTFSNVLAGTYTVTANIVSQGTTTYGGTPPTQTIVVPPSLSPAAASVVYSAMTGQLTVNVSGTTGGANPNVLVTGPFNFSRAITATGVTILTPLPLGSYTVAARSVTDGTATYAPPTLSQALAINSGALDGTTVVPYALVSGILDLTVSGLPDGLMANVTVTGPGGLDQTATVSQIFSNILTGTYTITANTVMQGSITYGGTPASQNIDVPASLTAATASVTYASIGAWTVRAPMSTPRVALGAGVVNGVLYALGGFLVPANQAIGSVEAYDPATNSWTYRAPMPTARYGLAVGAINGTLFAVGGYDGSYLSSAEAYDASTNTWTAIAPMPTARNGAAIGVLNGLLYAVGGSNGTALSTVEAYDPLTNSWTAKAPMPTARAGLAVGVLNGLLYAVGGTNGDSLSTVEAYDPSTNSWTTKAPMPTARYGLAVGVINGVLYAVGGRSIATTEAYDPSTDSWATKAPMPTARYGLAVGVINGVLYAVGGQRGGVFYTTLEAYTP